MKRKVRIVMSIVWIVLGLVFLTLSIAGILDSSLFSGIGGGLLAVGALQIIRQVRYSKNAAYREKVDVERNDERNKFISMKSWSLTGIIVVLVNAVGSFIAMMLGHREIQQVMLYSICLIVGVYWITYMILSRKY